MRAVGNAERPAIDITVRLLHTTPDLVLYGVAQWLLGAEVWKALQHLTAAGLLETRTAYPLLPAFQPTHRKSYRLTLAGLDRLAKEDVDDIVTRVKQEAVPAAPDTLEELPPDFPELLEAAPPTPTHIGDVCPLCGKTERPVPGPGNYTATPKLCARCAAHFKKDTDP